MEYQCKRYGINFNKQDEAYTSKADFFAGDYVPDYDANNLQEYVFSGRRITRGQYKSAAGCIINADINGALNIMRKSNLGGCKILQDSGSLEMPLRIRVA